MAITLEAMAAEIEELKKEVEKNRAYAACSNLMGRYSYYHSAARQKEYMTLWAKRDDDVLEMPWGIYDGYDSIYKCYVEDHGDRSDWDEKMLHGPACLFMHHLDTTVLQVSDDGMTARGAWLSPGHSTLPSRDNPGKFEAGWQFSKYGVDFIKEDGVWKIWHMRIYPLFKTPYGVSWGDQPPMDLKDYPTEQCDRGPSEYPFGFRMDTPYPADQPDPPTPYATFADVGESFFKSLKP